MASRASGSSFEYLLINRVPVGKGSRSGSYSVGSMWLEDLRAETRAVGAMGGRVVVALPIVEVLDVRRSGSFDIKEFTPEEEGFELVTLPWYGTWREYFRERGRIARALHEPLSRASIVKMDPSGHPLPLAGIVWAAAGGLGCKRVWSFDGGDFIGQMKANEAGTPSAFRRGFRRWRNGLIIEACRRGVREADVVFSHNAGTKEHFKTEWGPHCHEFDRSFVTKDLVASEAEIAQRVVQLKAAGAPLKLVVASRLIAIKAVDQVLRAVHKARRSADIVLDVYGDGDEAPGLRALAAQLGIEGAVTFHGAIPYGEDLFNRLRSAHVMVVTNIVPELSRNLLLAMALGLPIVGYRNPASDPMMARSGSGILVPAGDWDALAGELVAAATNRDRLVGCVAPGVAFARSTTLDECHRRRAELIRETLSERGSQRRAAAAGAPPPTLGAGCS